MDTHVSDSTTLWSEVNHLINTSPQGGWEVFWQASEEIQAKGFGSGINPITYQNCLLNYTAETTPAFSYACSDFSATTPLTPTTTNSNFGASTPLNYQSSIDSDYITMNPTTPTSEKEDTYQCTFCNKVFDKRHLLNRHLNLHTKPVSCPVCPHTTAKQRDMDRHILARHPASERGSALARGPKFPCPVSTCNRARIPFSRKDQLDRHTRNRH